MNAKPLLPALSLLLCAACAKTPSIPPAQLTLNTFELGPNNLYAVSFTSSVDLTTAFTHYEKANSLTPVFTCSLDQDPDLSVEHTLNVKAQGPVTPTSTAQPNHHFNAELVFYYTKPDGSQHDLNSYPLITPLIAKQSAIPCQVSITAYGYKAYYSQTLHIPSATLLGQLPH